MSAAALHSADRNHRRGRRRASRAPAPGLAGLALAAVAAVAAPACGRSPLVTQQEAAQAGLERAWFAHVPLDRTRSRVTSWYLHADRLYAVTNSGVITALNAETGEQLWSKQVGKPGHPAFGPSSNSQYIAIISGSKLYLLDRHDGRAIWVRPVGSAPSSGAALSESYAYVALITGRVEAYKLDQPDAQPWYYQSRGRTFLRPTVSGRVVTWPTSEGFLYIGMAENPGVVFRLKTAGDIVTSPAHSEPFLYVASMDGYLYCIHETTGQERWRFSTGYPITSSPAIVGKQAYVASLEPAIHAVNAETGAELWAAPGVSHFAAQGKQHVYGSDSFGNLVVLDPASGVVVARLNTAEGGTTLVNDQSDRLFLVNDRGLVQCLREIGAVEPTLYQQPPAPPAAPSGAAAAGGAARSARPAAAAEEAAADQPNPFEEEPPAADQPADDAAQEADEADLEPMEMETPVEQPPADDASSEAPSEDENPFE